MTPDIRLVAVDIDGTFMRSDYTYDVPRFERLLARMQAADCAFVVASVNQYWLPRDHFPGHAPSYRSAAAPSARLTRSATPTLSATFAASGTTNGTTATASAAGASSA